VYSIVAINGHQYKVKEGDLIDVEKLEANIGETVSFSNVLFVQKGDSVLVGAPTVANAKVVATVLKQERSRKLLVFKRKPGGYRRKKGHRQEYTCLKIDRLEC